VHGWPAPTRHCDPAPASAAAAAAGEPQFLDWQSAFVEHEAPNAASGTHVSLAWSHRIEEGQLPHSKQWLPCETALHAVGTPLTHAPS
jgi:hypothetical protein